MQSIENTLERRLLTHPHAIAVASRSNFMRAFFFLEKSRRRGLEAIYAFARVLDDAVDDWSSPEDQETALSFWEREFANARRGPTSRALPGRAPLFEELLWTIETFHVPLEPFYHLIRGCRSDIVTHRYATWSELEAYCYDVASTVGLLCLPIFGITDPAAQAPAIALGKALQLTNILRDVVEDVVRDRIYIPMEDFQRFGYDPAGLVDRCYNESFRALMDFEATRANALFQAATPLLERRGRAYLAPQLMGRTYWAILNKLKQQQFQVFSGKIALSKAHKLALFLQSLYCLLGLDHPFKKVGLSM